MKLLFDDRPNPWRFGPFLSTAILVAVCSFLGGCGQSKSSQSLEGQMKEMNLTRQPTAKFAGKVTIDGKAPRDAIKDGLFIMLYDPQKPPSTNMAPLSAIVNWDTGDFSFTTYSQGDGVPLGSYVVLFVALKHTVFGKNPGYHEPDALKNLYNDPDKNKDNPQFNVTVNASKSDYSFDLKLEGQEPASPGAHAITQFIR